MEPIENYPNQPNISVVTARLFQIILDMPFKDRRILLNNLETRHSKSVTPFSAAERDDATISCLICANPPQEDLLSRQQIHIAHNKGYP